VNLADFLATRTPPPSDLELLRRRPCHTHVDTLDVDDSRRPLFPVQRLALSVLRERGRLFGCIGVGHGKSAITYLAQRVTGTRRPLVVSPASMVGALRHEWAVHCTPYYGGTPPPVVSYEFVSHPNHQSWVEDYAPDLVMCDEGHALRNRRGAGAGRLLDWMFRPGVLSGILSGTLLGASLADYFHLLDAVLGDESPVPRHYLERTALADVCGARTEYTDQEAALVEPFTSYWCDLEPGASLRDRTRNAWRRRLETLPGIVVTTETSCDATLVLERVPFDLPPNVVTAMQEVEDYLERPDGSELSSLTQSVPTQRQLALGFYYAYPNPPDPEWSVARTEYQREIRRALGHRRWGDSPYHVLRSAPEGSPVRLAYARWTQAELNYPRGERYTVWYSEHLFDALEKWLDAHPRGCLWFLHTEAIADALRERGYDVWDHGRPQPTEWVPRAAFSRAYAKGSNLQAWTEALVLEFPAGGRTAEQLLGRHHRQGQDADVVTFCYLGNWVFDRAVEAATNDAQLPHSQGTVQKLCIATRVGHGEEVGGA